VKAERGLAGLRAPDEYVQARARVEEVGERRRGFGGVGQRAQPFSRETQLLRTRARSGAQRPNLGVEPHELVEVARFGVAGGTARVDSARLALKEEAPHASRMLDYAHSRGGLVGHLGQEDGTAHASQLVVLVELVRQHRERHGSARPIQLNHPSLHDAQPEHSGLSCSATWGMQLGSSIMAETTCRSRSLITPESAARSRGTRPPGKVRRGPLMAFPHRPAHRHPARAGRHARARRPAVEPVRPACAGPTRAARLNGPQEHGASDARWAAPRRSRRAPVRPEHGRAQPLFEVRERDSRPAPVAQVSAETARADGSRDALRPDASAARNFACAVQASRGAFFDAVRPHAVLPARADARLPAKGWRFRRRATPWVRASGREPRRGLR
jgi:hypothetical protein